MLFIFFKSHFLLKNKWSLISVNRACSHLATLSSADGQQPPEVGWGLSAEAGGSKEEGPVNSGPPPLAPEGDQQFSAGCLASVLTH